MIEISKESYKELVNHFYDIESFYNKDEIMLMHKRRNDHYQRQSIDIFLITFIADFCSRNSLEYIYQSDHFQITFSLTKIERFFGGIYD